MRITIISDLHIGNRAREFDLQPQGRAPHASSRGYLDYFDAFVKERCLSADVLVVSGDITDEAQPSQFRHAATVVNGIARSLGVPEGAIVAVPGNHDMNWDIAKLALEKSEPFWLDYKFQPFASGHRAFGCDAATTSALIEPPHFFRHEQPSADIWCFNSAAYDVPDLKPHRGEIREVHRVELEAALSAAYASGEKQKHRIFVTHHHPKAMPDLYPDIPDFSGMVNGESLLDLLVRHRFDLVLHGHKHKPWCRSFLEAGRDPIVVWCSGSFSHVLGPAYYGSIGNLWHLIEIEGSSDNGHAFGVVKSWAFAPAQGWVPSRPREHGIDHVTPFGFLTDRAAVTTLLRDRIAEALSSRTWFTWPEISANEPVLKYQSGPVVWAILQELAGGLGIRIHGDRDVLEGLMVLKEERVGAGNGD